MNYSDNSIQPIWGAGFDLFGLPSFATRYDQGSELFMPPGCSFLIERELFERCGSFDKALFMYADELDLSWRVWIFGGRAISVPKARLHHRLSAQVNPKGGGEIVELRTEHQAILCESNGMLVLLRTASISCFSWRCCNWAFGQRKRW